MGRSLATTHVTFHDVKEPIVPTNRHCLHVIGKILLVKERRQTISPRRLE